MIDWVFLFRRYKIDYVEKGPNVKKGNVNICCPFCIEDPSHHMGINISNGYWGCWRDTHHRGKSPFRLIQKLLRCSYRESKDIVQNPLFNKTKQHYSGIGQENIDYNDRASSLKLRESFKEIKNFGITKKFFTYLIEERDFRKIDVKEFCRYYNLKCCLVGNEAFRLVIPIYYENELMTWTGRSINNSGIRYLTLLKTDSVKTTDELVYNFDECNHSPTKKILVIVEGPLDTLKLDFYGKGLGVRVIGLFKNNMSEAQEYMVASLMRKYEKTYVLLDRGEKLKAKELVNRLTAYGKCIYSEVPEGKKDPGELSPSEVIWFSLNLVGGENVKAKLHS